MNENNENTSQDILNRRHDLRYQVREIAIGDIGVVTDISRGGARIKKSTEDEITVNEVVIPLTEEGLRATVVWQTDKQLGLKLNNPLKDFSSVATHLRFLQESPVDPYHGMMEDKLAGYQDDSSFHTLMELLVELDMPVIDINRLKDIIHQESGTDEIETSDNEIEQEDGKEADTVVKKQYEQGTLQHEILIKAAGPDADPNAIEIDLDYAISLLGIDSVKDVAKKYLKKQLIQSHSSMQNYEVFNILEAVVLHHLTTSFGYTDKDGKAKAMLSYETVGLESLVKNSDGLLDDYYSGPGAFYSEISRRYERLLFGTDMISLNYRFFNKNKESFTELFDGYIIAYQTLHPYYVLSDSVKLSLTSNNLRFASIASLLFLIINVIVEKDKKSGSALVKRLAGKGMKERRMSGIIEEIITEANHVLTEYEIPGKLGRTSLPSSFEKVEKSFPKEIHFSYLFDAFRKMDSKATRRIAIRYNDQTFAHFVLNRILNGADFELSSSNLCVIPCNNLLEGPLYFEDFSEFDLLVLKDVDRLTEAHFSIFAKLWSSFEGDIIVTYNGYHFIELNHDRLYQTIKEFIIDFPSYYASETIYKAMLNQTLEYMQKATNQEISPDKYYDDIYTMNEVKADILGKRVPRKKTNEDTSSA